jgi:hypothetical protein
VSATLEMSKKHLYANDPVTRAGRSVADREAIAIGKLKEDVQKAHTLDVAAQDLESILIVIKARRSDLRDTQGRLKDQIRLCQEEIGLGSRWGSKLPDAPDLHPGKVVATVKDIDSMLDDIDGETHLPEGTEATAEADPTGVPKEEEAPTEWEKSVTDEDIPESVRVAARVRKSPATSRSRAFMISRASRYCRVIRAMGMS